MSGTHPDRAASGGFTLMELLVAMTLLGILMTALFGSLRLGTRVWETSDRVLKNESQSISIRSFLRDRLEQAMPVELLLGSGRSEIVFAGQPQALRLASTMPESVGFGPYIIELVPTPSDLGGDRSDLSIRWSLIGGNSGEGEVTAGVSERLLVRDVARIALAYYGRKASEDAPVWHASWQEQQRLPALIRLEVGFEPGSDKHWPPLIVSPRVDEWFDTDS